MVRPMPVTYNGKKTGKVTEQVNRRTGFKELELFLELEPCLN